MSPRDDETATDKAWREIVAHYGERASVTEDLPASPPEPAPQPTPTPTPYDDPDDLDEPDDVVPEGERFVPPPPPPLPRPATWQRGLAWAGVFAAPLIALVLVITTVSVPSLVGGALATWFVGGFGYLVATMPPAPREPWDDGSRI